MSIASGQKGLAQEKILSWEGLSVENAELLRRDLCQVHRRPTKLGVDPEGNPLGKCSHRVARVARLACDSMRTFGTGHKRPVQYVPIQHLLDKKKLVDNATRYLKEPSRIDHSLPACVNTTKDILKYIFLGANPAEAITPQSRICDDVIDFFFRRFQKNDTELMTFLSDKRMYWDAPWSTSELEHELWWYAREATVFNEATQIIYYSGSGPFLFALEETGEEIRKAFIALGASGNATVTLVYPENSESHQTAVRELEKDILESSTTTGKTAPLDLIALPPTTSGDPPRMSQYFYLNARDGGEHAHVLIARDLDGHDRVESLNAPLSIRCTTELEISRFTNWVESHRP